MSKLSDFLNTGFQIGDKLGTVRTLPENWLELDGSAYDRADYPTLSPFLPVETLAFTAFTAQSLPTSGVWRAPCWDGALYFVFRTGTTDFRSSVDGATWTAGTMPSSAPWLSSAAGNGIIVVTPESGTAGAYSTNGGASFTAMAMPSAGQWAVTFGNGLFVAVKFGSDAAATSPDGFTWTPRTLPTSANWTAVAWNGTIFFATSSNTATAYSTAGTTWTLGANPGSGYESVSVGPGNLFLLVRTNSTGPAYTTPDGINITSRTIPAAPTNIWGAVVGTPALFMIFELGGSGAISSPDAVTWTAQTMPSVSSWSFPVYGDRILVSSGTSGSGKVAQSNLLANITKFVVPDDPGVSPLVNYIRAK